MAIFAGDAMVLRGGMPKMIMLIELTGDDEKELMAKLGELHADILKFAARTRESASTY